jgi:adenine/guanine phosphoribosyltransferase-like PRPP-binding protein
MSEVHTDAYRVEIGSQVIGLPLIEVGGDRAISLLMTIDRGVGFLATAGAELAELLRPDQPEVVASAATLGIPVAIEVSRALGLDDYVILQKTPKVHLGDALSEPVRSVTTATPQRLLLDRARLGALAGRRVAFVDDVVATGSSLAAGLRLLRAGGAEVVSIGVLLTEGGAWRKVLGADADLVHSLGRIPGFQRVPGGWAEDWFS